MKTSFKLVALLAAAFLLPGSPAQAAANANNQNAAAAQEASDAQLIERAINSLCAKSSPTDQQACRKREYAAEAALEHFGAVPQAVFDKCTTKRVMDAGYTAALKCLQEGTAPTNQAAATALSTYASAAQEQFLGMALKNDLYLSKIQQDIEFKDLDKFREDANVMAEMARESRQKVAELRYPASLSEKQRGQFESVSKAMTALSDAIVSMNADVAVHADTGLNVNSRLERDIAIYQKAGQKFRLAVMAAYKAFGYPENQVNPKTLKLKNL